MENDSKSSLGQYGLNIRKNQISICGYDAIGRKTNFIYPYGVVTTNTHVQANKLTRILHQKSLPSPLGGEGEGEGIIEDLTYAYDAAGNRISFTRSGPQAALPQPVQAAYDAANEMLTRNSELKTQNLLPTPGMQETG